MNAKQLFENIKKKKSFLCVGLDTDLNLIPKFLLEKEYPIFEFNKHIINSTSKYTVAYKPNLAFYESLGAAGWISLELTVNYLKENFPDIFIIADAKRGDIGNTSKLYATTFLKNIDFDAVTVAPYMGEDSVSHFLAVKDKWAIVLALTSNKGSQDFQMIKDADSGKPVHEIVLEKVSKWGTTDNIMFVVGATKAEYFKQIRKIVPNHFLLVPGVGAQGGDLEKVAEYGMNSQCGLLVNSSRGIIYADGTDRFAMVAGEKAQEVQQQMEKLMVAAKLI